MTKKTKTKTKKQKELAEIAREAFFGRWVVSWGFAHNCAKEHWRRVVNAVLEEAALRMEANLYKK